MFGNQVMKYYISASASDGHSALWWKLSWDGGSRGRSLPLLVHSYQDGMVDSSCFLLWHFMITLKRKRDREPMGGDCPFLLSWCLMEFWILVLGPSPIAEFLEGITAEGWFDLGGGGWRRTDKQALFSLVIDRTVLLLEDSCPPQDHSEMTKLACCSSESG